MKKLLLVGLILSVTVFVGCGGSSSGGGTNPSTPSLVSISVSPSTSSIAPGATQQLTATGNFSDGTTKNLTSSANWTTSSAATASVSIAGLATGVAPGTATISAQSSGVTGTATVTVTNALVSIAVSPTTASVAPNGTQQYTATGTYADHSTQNITSTVTWNATSGATINSAGLATGATPGATSTITATLSGVTSNSAALTVTNQLVSIAITPVTALVAPNATQQYTATGTYTNGSHQNITTSVTWNATSGASISASGLATGVTPNATSTVTASLSGVTSNSATLTVTNPLVSIAVSPSTASVAPNANQQYTATGTYADNSTQNITTTVTWTASAGATIGAHTGLATAVTPNATVTITATLNNISGMATMSVTNPLVSIAVTPNLVSVSPVPPNNTQQFTATGTYADHSTQNITNSVGWSASIGATITAGGLATAITPNASVTIMATSGNISGTATMNVTNPLVSIAVTPAAPQIAAGTTQQFVATGTYADHSTQVITSTVTWASSNTTVATISNSAGTQGLANGLTAGPTNITASLNGITSPNDVLTVTSATLVSIAVTPPSVQIIRGQYQDYIATGTFSDGTKQNITDTVTWSSSDTAHIKIYSGGKAFGVATTSSPVTISATQNSITGSTTATVIPPTLVSIAITPNIPQMAQRTAVQLTATGTETNGSTINVTNLATWTSSNSSIATVDHNGLVTAQPVSSPSNPVTISVAYSGVTQTIAIDVTNATPNTVTVTPVSPAIPAGVNLPFTATASFSDGTSQDVSQTSFTNWSSSNTTVANVTKVGLATSLAPGTSTIAATFGGVSGSAVLTVTSATLTSIAVVPSGSTAMPVVLSVGSNLSFEAIGTYSDGTTQYVTNFVTWASEPSGVVGFSGSTATGLSAGNTNVTATYGPVTSSQSYVVVPGAALVSIAITVPNANLPAGVSEILQAVGTFADGSTQNLTINATWASTQPSIATVSRQGIVLGGSPGQTTITAIFSGIVGSTTLTVSNATIASLAVSPANQSVPVGTRVSYTATGTFSDSSIIDLTSQSTWSSLNPIYATINSGGQANAASPGTTVIRATFTQTATGGPVTVSDSTNLSVTAH